MMFSPRTFPLGYFPYDIFFVVSVGLAYGLMTSVQNAGLAVFPLILAALFHHSHSRYVPNCEYFFMLLATIGIIIGAMMNYDDYWNHNILNSGQNSKNNKKNNKNKRNMNKNNTLFNKINTNPNKYKLKNKYEKIYENERGFESEYDCEREGEEGEGGEGGEGGDGGDKRDRGDGGEDGKGGGGFHVMSMDEMACAEFPMSDVEALKIADCDA